MKGDPARPRPLPPAGTVGIQVLTANEGNDRDGRNIFKSFSQEVRTLVPDLSADHVGYQCINVVLSPSACGALRNHVDAQYEKTSKSQPVMDFKLDLPRANLESLIGAQTVHELTSRWGCSSWVRVEGLKGQGIEGSRD